MKTLGIIGGIAPASTIEYYRMLIATHQQRRPDGSNPPVVINSIDMQTMLRLIAADALDEVTAYLSTEIDKLVRAGADVGLRAGLLAVVERLRAREGIDGIILGGTELPLILRDVANVGIPFLDTGRIHAEAAVEQMLA